MCKNETKKIKNVDILWKVVYNINRGVEKMDRVIMHIDINNCYASIEQKLNPELKGKAIAVCGSIEDRRGIVLAKSELAKKCGVQTGEVIWQAKQKCKDLIVVKPHYEEYVKHSKMAQALYYEYTNFVEPFGIDECWIDVTESKTLFGTGEEIAAEILRRMKEEVGLTVSIGVSFNKVFAKLGSDMKKPDAMTVIKREEFKEKIWSLNANELLTIGRQTTKKLNQFGIRTIGDVANADPVFMKTILGKNGYDMWRYANGLDNSKVSDAISIYKGKSVSNGFTCRKNLVSRSEIRTAFSVLAQKVSHRLIEDKVKCECVQIGLKDNTLHMEQYQTTLRTPINNSVALLEIAMELVDKHHTYEKPVRALTLRTTHLVEEDVDCQLDLFNYYQENDKREKIEKVIVGLEDRFDKRIVKLGTSLNSESITSGVDQLVFLPMMTKP